METRVSKTNENLSSRLNLIFMSGMKGNEDFSIARSVIIISILFHKNFFKNCTRDIIVYTFNLLIFFL